MIRLLVPIVLIYISQGAYAFDNSSDLQIDPGTRSFSGISDLFPNPREMDCAPTCEGGRGCGQFTDVDACIDDGADLGCFWTCQ